MKNRRTIEALKRLAERPGTPAEGEVARAMLEKLGVRHVKDFDPAEWPEGKRVFYNYWAYFNEAGAVCKQPHKIQRGQIWLRIKFDRLKQARWVPVSSEHYGCHLTEQPMTREESKDTWNFDWRENERELWERLNRAGIFDERKSRLAA